MSINRSSPKKRCNMLTLVRSNISVKFHRPWSLKITVSFWMATSLNRRKWLKMTSGGNRPGVRRIIISPTTIERFVVFNVPCFVDGSLAPNWPLRKKVEQVPIKKRFHWPRFSKRADITVTGIRVLRFTVSSLSCRKCLITKKKPVKEYSYSFYGEIWKNPRKLELLWNTPKVFQCPDSDMDRQRCPWIMLAGPHQYNQRHRLIWDLP